MRLSEPQTQRVQEQTGASVVPEDNPSMPALKQNFGDHTFFLDAEGLHIWETVADEPSEDGKLRSEEHTSELQSLMRISSAVFCWKKKQYKLYLALRTHTILYTNST